MYSTNNYLFYFFSKKGNKNRQDFQPQLDSLAGIYEPESNELWYAENALLEPSLSAAAPDLDDVIDHIDYIADLISVDHVGLGADWDGVEIMPTGIEDISKLPSLTKKLIERGYSKRDIGKILGGNFKRVFKDVVNY